MRHLKHGRKVAAVIVVFVGLSSVAACHRSPAERVDKIANRISSKLDFNDQQNALLKDITQEIKNDIKEMKATREARFKDFEQVLMAPSLDKARVKAHLKERQDFQGAKTDKYLEKVAALHATLNPEQKIELLEKIQKFHGHWE